MTISSIALIIKGSEKTLADIVYQHLFYISTARDLNHQGLSVYAVKFM